LEKESNKCLYTCESMVDKSEYVKMSKSFWKKLYFSLLNRGLYLNLIIFAIIAILSKNIGTALVYFLVFQIWATISFKVKFEDYAEKAYDDLNKHGNLDSNFTTEFYDDYLIRKSESVSYTIKYTEIAKFIETDTNLYLEHKPRNVVLIFQKNRLDLELIEFIRKTFGNIENETCSTPTSKKAKKAYNPDFIKTAMLVLFIITIASLWGALYTKSWVDQLIPQYGFSTSKNMWVFWCWLPIPILSIILGFKYKKAGFKCTKNIVGGFIIGFFLLVYGSFCMFPTNEQDYTKINDYKEIVNLELPDSGVLEIIDWDSHPNRNMTEYTTINAYYAQVDVTKLVESIGNNPNWILSKEFRTDMNVFLTSSLVPDDDAYFSIYNKTTNEYNVLPEKSGEYEVYAMKYDKSDKKLQIDKFKISYNK